MIMMQIYYENFNPNSNFILTECLEHLKIGGEYNTKLFFGENFVFVEGRIGPSSLEIDPCWKKKIKFREIKTKGIDPL